MQIVVCLKQVPDTTQVMINPITGALIRNDVQSIINPEDKNALEEALRIKEEKGGKVSVITMGPSQAESVLREAMAMGADEAILLTDRIFAGSDTLATSYALAKILKKLKYDIIFTGSQSIDGATSQVGPKIAEFLDIPQITYAKKIYIEGDSLMAVRILEDSYEVVETRLPCLVTATKELNEPRLMNVNSIIESNNKEIKVFSAKDIGILEAMVGEQGSPTCIKESWEKEVGSRKQIVNLPPKEMGELVASELKSNNFI